MATQETAQPPVLFIEGKWRGKGKSIAISTGETRVHYLEEMTVERQGKHQHYWYHRQTWLYDPNDPEETKKVALHVESGCIKFLPPPADAPTDAEDYPVEGNFIHPFSLMEISVGTLSKDEKTLSLLASKKQNSFKHGPGAKGKQTTAYSRVFESLGPDTMRYKCGLAVESEDAEPLPHLECELTRVVSGAEGAPSGSY
ncbi:unnamed protein product [Amoebophrya sp. A120]|nr:unnamed protein product [Amoebophrya sp. A120]|eukprot:GSA120T00019000001.1